MTSLIVMWSGAIEGVRKGKGSGRKIVNSMATQEPKGRDGCNC